MDFTEITKSIKATLYDRSVSPLIGAFIVSWLGWNYKFVMVLFSELSVQEKFTLIDSSFSLNFFELDISNSDWWWNLLLVSIKSWILPALTTWLYLYVYPRIAKPVYGHALKNRKELNDLKKANNEEELLTVEESQKIKREARKLIREAQAEITQREQEIEDLKVELKDISSPPEKTKSNVDFSKALENTLDKINKLTSDQTSMLQTIASQANETPEAFLLVKFKHIGTAKTKYHLDQLVQRKYILDDYSSYHEDNTYESTAKGRAYLVENDIGE